MMQELIHAGMVFIFYFRVHKLSTIRTKIVFLILMVISRAQNRLGSVEVSAILKVKEAPKPLELTMIPHGK